MNKGDFMYKLIACDLDETLLNDEHEICEKNVIAIKKASKLGVKFVPATGRGYRAIENILKKLDLYNKQDEYIISFNGCSLVECKNYKTILFNGLPFYKADEIFKFGLTKDVCIQIYTEDTVYMYNLNTDEKNRNSDMKTHFIELKEPSIKFLKNTPIAKMIFQNTDVPYLMSFEDKMKHITEGQVNVSYSSNRYMEMNKSGVNKGESMLSLAALLGIKKEETIAVGDNYNDLSMLKAAGLSIAAGNAVDGVKEICGYTCKNNNNEGVLMEVIDKFILS